jgi:hypothetical protein
MKVFPVTSDTFQYGSIGIRGKNVNREVSRGQKRLELYSQFAVIRGEIAPL